MEALLILSKEYTVAFTYLQIDVYLDIYVQFVENQCVKKKKIKRNCKKDITQQMRIKIHCFSTLIVFVTT